jgi:phage-related protein
VTWRIEFFSDRVEASLAKLPAGLLARFVRYAERMEVYGPDLGMPHSRAMGDGLVEVRLKAAEGIGRVLYCTLIGRRIVVLHHFVKKSDKAPPKEIELARQRMKEIST